MAYSDLRQIQLFGMHSFNPFTSPPSGRTLVTGTGTGSRFAIIVRPPRTGQVRYVILGFGTCTAPQDMRLALNDITANTNKPDNTDDAYVVVPSGSLTTQSLLRMGPLTHDGTAGGTMKTVTAGVPLAIVLKWEGASGTLVTPNIENSSGTPQNNNSMSYNTRWGGSSDWFGSDLSATRMQLEYSDGSVESVHGWSNPWAGSTQHTFQVGSTPDEYAMYWEPRFSGKIRRVGTWPGNTTAQLEWSIYQDSTLIERYTQDPRDLTSISGGPAWGLFNDVEFLRGTLYRISCRPSTAANTTIYSHLLNSAFRASGPWGPLGCLSTRVNNGAWTEDTTKIPMYILGLSAIDLTQIEED